MSILKQAEGAIRFVTEKVTDFQEGFREATSFLDPVEDLATKAMEAESKLPAGLAAEGAMTLGERLGLPSVLLPLLGMVSAGGGIRLRRTRVGTKFPEVAEAASRHLDEAYPYMRSGASKDPTKPLQGYPNFLDPTGEEWVVRSKGKLKDGTPRVALTPLKEKLASTNVRLGRDVTSDEFEAFQRKQFNQMVKQTKSDTMVQFADMPSYVEHNRRLSSPYWNTARAKGQKAGDVDNLSQLFDLDFKTFKDNVDKALDRIPDSPIDAYYDPLVDSIVVENIKTGKQLGYLDQTTDIKTQLNKFIQKVK